MDDNIDWLFIVTLGDGNELVEFWGPIHEPTNLTTDMPIMPGTKADCTVRAKMKVWESHNVRGDEVPPTLTETAREYNATPNAP